MILRFIKWVVLKKNSLSLYVPFKKNVKNAIARQRMAGETAGRVKDKTNSSEQKIL